MQTSAEINELAVALIQARAQFGPVHKDTDNTFFKSRYASLAAIAGATLPALADQGISVIQGAGRSDEAGLEVLTRLVHVTGQWIETAMWLPMVGQRRKDKDGSEFYDPITAQSAGSAFTYGRRYALAAALGIVADEDDDAEQASSGSRESRPGTRPKAKATEGEAACPTCHGAMWDNRPKKAAGDFSQKAPDFKCKDKSCDGCYWPGQWPPSDEKADEKTPSWQDGPEPEDPGY